MAPRYDEAPETVPPAIPEYHPAPTAPEVSVNHGYVQQQSLPPAFKREDSAMYNHYPGYAMSPMGPPSTQNYDTTGYGSLPSDMGGRRREKRTIMGCSVVVFVLAVIIAILSAAVIGLAAGTGVEANRANTAESDLAALRANMTTSSSSSSIAAGNYSALTRDCSTNSTGVSGTTYTSKFFDLSSYQIACNKDTANVPLQGLFVGNFDDCMDACASYTHHISENFANSTANVNKTCSGVTFVPGWTDRQVAVKGTAPGNCYLKPGPQGKAKLSVPSNGQETHSAFRLDD
ncbi:hypothetical protein PG996_010078 [Apiospora saccharicola]|uniref:Uncharacterized protein n=1 Tax=Apiospora saccharicola TaxID=335842 RepID=A0ABR1UMI9_9PEZI